MKYTSETAASVENQGELDNWFENVEQGADQGADQGDWFENMEQGVDQGDRFEKVEQGVDRYSHKYSQSVSKSFDNLSKDDEDTCKLFLNLYHNYLNKTRAFISYK